MVRPLRRTTIFVTRMAGCILLFHVPSGWADYPTSVLDDRPLGYWKLNDPIPPSAPNLGDAGSLWDGTYHGGGLGLSGPTELADGTRLEGMGFASGSYEVGGQDTYLSVDAPVLSDLAEFTMSGWVFPDPRTEDRVGLWGQNDVVEFGFSQPNQLQLWTAQGGPLEWDFDPVSDLPASNWHHLAASGDGSQLRLYLNGNLVASKDHPAVDNYGSGPSLFHAGGGGIFDATGNQLMGQLSELAVWDRALSADRLQAHFQSAIGAGEPGDFNLDGQIDTLDINLLTQAIIDESLDTLYDVDNNGVVDLDDQYFWVAIIKNTWLGDANLDGEFSSTDFVQVFQFGKYEDAAPNNAGWEEGDWDADADFTTLDFVAAFNEGGYELGPRAVATVPEPATNLMWIVAGLYVATQHRRRGFPRNAVAAGSRLAPNRNRRRSNRYPW